MRYLLKHSAWLLDDLLEIEEINEGIARFIELGKIRGKYKQFNDGVVASLVELQCRLINDYKENVRR